MIETELNRIRTELNRLGVSRLEDIPSMLYRLAQPEAELVISNVLTGFARSTTTTILPNIRCTKANINQLCASMPNLLEMPIINGGDYGIFTHLNSIFDGCKKMKAGPITIEAPLCTTSTTTFKGCKYVTDVNLHLPKTTSCLAMFFKSGLKRLNNGQPLELPMCTNMSEMFYETPLEYIPQVIAPKVNNMYSTFGGCRYVTSIYPDWDLPEVQNMFMTFAHIGSSTNVNGLGLVQNMGYPDQVMRMNLPKVNDLAVTFYNNWLLKSLYIDLGPTSRTITFNKTFGEMRNLESLEIVNAHHLPDDFVVWGSNNIKSIKLHGYNKNVNISNLTLEEAAITDFVNALGTATTARVTFKSGTTLTPEQANILRTKNYTHNA